MSTLLEANRDSDDHQHVVAPGLEEKATGSLLKKVKNPKSPGSPTWWFVHVVTGVAIAALLMTSFYNYYVLFFGGKDKQIRLPNLESVKNFTGRFNFTAAAIGLGELADVISQGLDEFDSPKTIPGWDPQE